MGRGQPPDKGRAKQPGHECEAMGRGQPPDEGRAKQPGHEREYELEKGKASITRQKKKNERRTRWPRLAHTCYSGLQTLTAGGRVGILSRRRAPLFAAPAQGTGPLDHRAAPGDLDSREPLTGRPGLSRRGYDRGGGSRSGRARGEEERGRHVVMLGGSKSN